MPLLVSWIVVSYHGVTGVQQDHKTIRWL